MKRALAILAVASMFGFAGFAQFSGEWDTNINVLSSLSLDYTKLTINYEWSGWTFTSLSKFTDEGYSDQSFDVSGTLGATTIEGSMAFSPGDEWLKHYVNSTTAIGETSFSEVKREFGWKVAGPHYLDSSLSTSMDFAGVSFALDITHEADYVANFSLNDFDWPQTGSEPIDSDCYDKYMVVAEAWELDAPVEITFWDDTDDNDVIDDGETSATIDAHLDFEYSGGDLVPTPESSEYIDNIVSALAGAGWGNPKAKYEVDSDDVVVRAWLPSYMTLTLTAEADPFKAEVVFDDVCTGIQFKEATISLSDLSLCCGISYDAELAFNKCKGFDYLEFTAKDLFPICCGISFDMSVKFTNDNTKEVSIKPKMEEIGDACFTLYTDLDWSDNTIGGLEVYGWKVRCDLAECNYIEILSALNVDKVEDILNDTTIFEGDEFQYAKLGFCGPGCCGGNYSVDLSVFFDNGGGLFGISRLGADMAIPVMSNFTVNSSFAVKTGGGTTLDVGWTFTF